MYVFRVCVCVCVCVCVVVVYVHICCVYVECVKLFSGL